jgi:HlyD family secretion protein
MMKLFKTKGKMKWIIILAAVLVIGIVSMTSMSKGISSETAKVTRGEMKQYVEDTALVQSKDKQTVYIEGTGKVVQVNVNMGDVVKKGDLLLSLDKTDLELQLKDAEAKIEASKAQLKGTELVNYANKIEQAKAAVDQAQASFDSAKRNYDNSNSLYQAKALSENEFKTVADAYKTAQAALNTATLQYEDVKKGTPDYIRNGYEAQLEQADIFRDTIARNIQKQEVRADIDGVVIDRLVDNNALVSPATAAFVIGSVNNLELESDILEDDISKVKIGDEALISGKPIGDEVIKAEVVKIAPAAKDVVSSLGVNQKRVPVTLKINDKANLLRPGYSLDVKIITNVKSNIIKVPDTAVFDLQDSSRVFVVENGKAVLKTVKKGIESDNFVEITDGLKDGDTILVKPDNTIKEGSKITPVGKSQ